MLPVGLPRRVVKFITKIFQNIDNLTFLKAHKIIDKDETGLVFECMNLDKETMKCKIHKSRPGLCRRYPQEELFMMGGTLAEHCGYRLEPIESFEEVFNKVSKKKQK